MKHLRSFNEDIEYWIQPGILQDLKDICLELTDIGLSYDIFPDQEEDEFYVRISDKTDDEESPLGIRSEEDWITIIDCIERIKDYMKIHGQTADEWTDEYGITLTISF